MRGTVAFEVMDCATKSRGTSSNETYLRILFNDAVYPIAGCHSGPGKSCSLSAYASIIQKKMNEAGKFQDYCNVTESSDPEDVLGARFPDLCGTIVSCLLRMFATMIVEDGVLNSNSIR
jgi:hypothetical protein